MDIYQQLETLLKKKVKKHDITADAKLKELGIDSLELLSIVVELEDSFSVTFEDDELSKLETVGDVISTIERKIKK
jgi:acyl carrier protein